MAINDLVSTKRRPLPFCKMTDLWWHNSVHSGKCFEIYLQPTIVCNMSHPVVQNLHQFSPLLLFLEASSTEFRGTSHQWHSDKCAALVNKLVQNHCVFHRHNNTRHFIWFYRWQTEPGRFWLVQGCSSLAETWKQVFLCICSILAGSSVLYSTHSGSLKILGMLAPLASH